MLLESDRSNRSGATVESGVTAAPLLSRNKLPGALGIRNRLHARLAETTGAGAGRWIIIIMQALPLDDLVDSAGSNGLPYKQLRFTRRKSSSSISMSRGVVR